MRSVRVTCAASPIHVGIILTGCHVLYTSRRIILNRGILTHVYTHTQLFRYGARVGCQRYVVAPQQPPACARSTARFCISHLNLNLQRSASAVASRALPAYAARRALLSLAPYWPHAQARAGAGGVYVYYNCIILYYTITIIDYNYNNNLYFSLISLVSLALLSTLRARLSIILLQSIFGSAIAITHNRTAAMKQRCCGQKQKKQTRQYALLARRHLHRLWPFRFHDSPPPCKHMWCIQACRRRRLRRKESSGAKATCWPAAEIDEPRLRMNVYFLDG